MMEGLSLEGKAVFETVTAANDKFKTDFKAEIRDLIASAVAESVTASVDLAVEKAVDKAVGAKVNNAVQHMQAYTDGVEADLRASLGLASLEDDSSSPPKPPVVAAETGPSGHRTATTTRGTNTAPTQAYVPPPARGIQANHNTLHGNSYATNSFGSLVNRERRASAPNHGKPPSMDFPKFCGNNPKFWQARSEDYFSMFDTDPELWIAVAAMQFEGDAAQWLSSVQHKLARSTWQEFCAAVMHRFGKNQHQTLVRKLYRLRQTTSVVAYISAFSALMDQLSAYEPHPDMLHYTTRFIDGLKPAVRITVAVQLPPDLDTAYAIALVQEEVAEDDMEMNTPILRPSSVHSSRQTRQFSPRSSEDSRLPPSEPAKSSMATDDKLATLKAYRKAKGLCFICGERWGKEHKCNSTVQLHVVQEMLEFCSTDSMESDDSDDNLMVLSAETQSSGANTEAIRLQCQVAGFPVLFLLDSGSSHSFISERLAPHIPQVQPLQQHQRVRIAGGGYLSCSAMAPNCTWTAGGQNFQSDFKVLPLKHYDGIIGMDWLSERGTMNINWQQKWLSFDYKGAAAFLQGEPPANFECTVVELQLVQQLDIPLPAEIQSLLDKHAAIFSTPSELPPEELAITTYLSLRVPDLSRFDRIAILRSSKLKLRNRSKKCWNQVLFRSVTVRLLHQLSWSRKKTSHGAFVWTTEI
jgi:hypothetical protein